VSVLWTPSRDEREGNISSQWLESLEDPFPSPREIGIEDPHLKEAARREINSSSRVHKPLDSKHSKAYNWLIMHATLLATRGDFAICRQKPTRRVPFTIITHSKQELWAFFKLVSKFNF
jgi:hypothetical protein